VARAHGRAARSTRATPAAPPPLAGLTPVTGESLTSFEVEGLSYELDRPPTQQGRRSVATVRLAGLPTDPGFTDRVDLFAFKSRHTFAVRVANAFGRQPGQVLGHLALILDRVERARASAPARAPEELTPERRAAAEDLLQRTEDQFQIPASIPSARAPDGWWMPWVK